MELSRELFDQIVSHLKGAPSGSDKRQKPRVGLRQRVDFTPLNAPGTPSQGRISVLVRDLSPGGIGVVHHQNMPADSFFAIRLPSSAVGALIAVYKVKHCVLVEKDLYRIGAQLVKLSPITADPAHVGDPAAEPPAAAKEEPAKSTKQPEAQKAAPPKAAAKTPVKEPAAAAGA